MRIAVISVTGRGSELSADIAERLTGHNVIRYAFEKYPNETAVKYSSLSELTEKLFYEYDALVFICACGVAVRAVSPFVNSKISDPAVIAADENGRFIIPVLSGHLGGANALAEKIALITGGIPVITTATDIGKKFSPDSFAKANRLYITDMNTAKLIAAAVLKGEEIGVYSDFPCENMPEQLSEEQGQDFGICISADEKLNPFKTTLNLIPKDIIIGAGCRKNLSPEYFEKFILERLNENGISVNRVCSLATADLKKDEPALIKFCRKYGISMEIFTPQQLMDIKGDFSHSEFVMKITGTDNVCERSVSAAGGRLIIKKQSGEGVTFAAGLREISIDFERRLL